MTANSFDLSRKVAVVTGGYGVLGGSIADGRAAANVRVAILGRRREVATAKAEKIPGNGGESVPLVADVLDREQVQRACDELL